MLDTPVAVQIVISFCVGLSYLAINHYNTFLKVKGYIKAYFVMSLVIFSIISFFYYDAFKNFQTISNHFFELSLISFPYPFYSVLTYVGFLISKEKRD